MHAESILYILDLAGTGVFAMSGAAAAMKKNLDFFGVLVLAVVTAMGGGTIRDILLNDMPPFYFHDAWYLSIAIGTAVVVFFIPSIINRLNTPVVVFDAIGLGVFTIIGAQKALAANLEFAAVLILAMLTGIGGGLIRDVLRGEVPFVLRKEIYASASLLGAMAYYFAVGIPVLAGWPAMLLAAAITTTTRLLSVHFQLNMPTEAPHIKSTKKC